MKSSALKERPEQLLNLYGVRIPKTKLKRIPPYMVDWLLTDPPIEDLCVALLITLFCRYGWPRPQKVHIKPSEFKGLG